MDSLGGGKFKSFTFKDGEMLGDNPDMKLEEEKTDENGTVTKKYSDGKGNTMIFSEKFGQMIKSLKNLKIYLFIIL